MQLNRGRPARGGRSSRNFCSFRLPVAGRPSFIGALGSRVRFLTAAMRNGNPASLTQELDAGVELASPEGVS